MLEEAISYAQRGWHVFPLRGKRPITPHGWMDATTNTQTVVAMFAGTSYNVGIATGPSGLLVVDLDTEEAIEWWSRQGSPLTLVATTGRGQHWYYAGKGRSTAGTLHAGVDTRGEGGYVVAPPSEHPVTGARYRWLDPDLAPAPLPTWVDLSPRKKRRKPFRPARDIPPHRYLHQMGGEVEKALPGQRNDTLNFVAYCARQFKDDRLAVMVLVPAGLKAGLTWEETTRTVASGLGIDLGVVLDVLEEEGK